MNERLTYFRPGEEARMLARCQFDLLSDGNCSVIMTYPIKGYPWRRNPFKLLRFHFAADVTAGLFHEVVQIRRDFPEDCLTDGLWSDSSEKANGITRDIATNTLCYTIGIYGADGMPREHYALREDSKALLDAGLHRTVTELICEFETP